MKKFLKVSIICIMILSIVMVINCKVFAANDDVIVLDDLLTGTPENIQDDENNSSNNSNNSNSNNSSNSSNTSNEGTTIPIDNPSTIPEEPEPIVTPEPVKTEPVKTEPESVKEEKIPQTGEAENYMLIVAVIAFSGIAIYAYKKSKKINL